MKKFLTIIGLLMFSATLVLTSCKKDDDDPVLPTISFKQDVGYVSANTTAGYGDTLKFGVICNSNGTDNLVNFKLFANNDQMLDSTINTNAFTFDFYTTKTILDKDVWKFVATDFAGNMKADSITITGSFGDIYTYGSLVFGAQDNTEKEGFLSYSNGTVTPYFQDAAFDHQADIDMFCFYENTVSHQNLMTLAAPGSNITGIFEGPTSPENYTVKNVTFFVKTDLSPAQFDAVSNDAVILASFDPENKFKKAKLLTAGEVYAFQLQSGKFGLYKVINVEGEEAGTLEIAVKIQK